MRRKIIILGMVIIMSSSFLYPRNSEAGVFDTILKGVSCAGSKYAGLKLADYITSRFGGALKGSVPVNDGTLINKFTYIDIINTCLVRVVFDKTVDGMLGVVRTRGENGGPTWILNWRNFQANSQYRGENIFRAILSTTNLCDYFGKDLQKAFGVTNKIPLANVSTRIDDIQSFDSRAGCTLPKDFDAGDYEKDFIGNGGWDAWNRIIETQNNPYGAALISLAELSKQRSLEEESALNEAEAGQGYLSIKGGSSNSQTRTSEVRRGDVPDGGVCKGDVNPSPGNLGYSYCSGSNSSCASVKCTISGGACVADYECQGVSNNPNDVCRGICKPNASIPPGASQFSSACAVRTNNGQCISYNNIKTPGNAISSVVAATFGQDLGSLSSQKDLADSLSFVIERLTNRLLDLGKSEKNQTYDKDYNYSPPPIPDEEEEGPSCGIEGLPNLYTSAVSAAVFKFINDPANADVANGSAAEQANIDRFLYGVIKNFESAVSGARAGRVRTCSGNVGTDAIMVGKTTDSLGEIYDLISGVGRDTGAPIKESTQVTGDEHADWSRLIENVNNPGPGQTPLPPPNNPPSEPNPTPEPPPAI